MTSALAVLASLGSACVVEVTGFDFSASPEATLTERTGPGLSDYWRASDSSFVRFYRTNGRLWARGTYTGNDPVGPITLYDVTSDIRPMRGERVVLALVQNGTSTRNVFFIETGSATLERLWIFAAKPGRLERAGRCSPNGPKQFDLPAHPLVQARFDCDDGKFLLSGFAARPGAGLKEMVALIVSGLIARGDADEFLRVEPGRAGAASKLPFQVPAHDPLTFAPQLSPASSPPESTRAASTRSSR